MRTAPGRVMTGPSNFPIAAAAGVPFFSQAVSFDAVWPAISRQLDELVDQNSFSHGAKVRALEAAIAGWTGARFAVGVNSGTDALVLLLRAAGLRTGDEVVVAAYGAVASASAVLMAGGRPVFADIDPVGYALEPAAAAAAVTDRTRVLLPAHAAHEPADLAGLTDLSVRRGLTLLEDSASALGLRWAGRHAGLQGRGGVLSFFPTKTLGAIGDAGMVITDDERIAELVGALRDHGRAPGGTGPSLMSGVNSKMDELQAAVLLAKLDRLDRDISVRAQLAAAYDERLRSLPGVLRLPTVQPRPVPTTTVFSAYVVAVERRDALVAHLARRGIGTEVSCPRPLHLQPCFAALGGRPGQFPVAEAAAASTLSLPLHADLRPEQVELVCDAISEFAAERP